MATLATEDRSPVKLKDIPQVLINAVISIEDRKFYEHHGVDWAGTVRALFKNVDAGGIAQGGSTITQQLVKNTFSVNRKRDLKTKAREAVLAIELEKQLTQEPDPRGLPEPRLLRQRRVRRAGRGRALLPAARRSPSSTSPQAALLAGLIQSPEALNPIKHPGAAARRRSEVLDAMVANGKATPRRGPAGEVGAAADDGQLSALGAARLLHGRGQERPAQRRPERAGRSGRGARLDPAGARQRGLPRRPEDLHVVRPDAAVRGDRRR